MRGMISGIAFFLLTGCITIHGPIKQGNQPESQANNPGLLSDTGISVDSSVLIKNRKSDEIHSAIEHYFRQKGVKITVSNLDSGLVAAIGNDETLAGLWLDCYALKQTQNIQRQYRLIGQSWSAGEGTRIQVQVNGTAGLVAADGNEKVKPEECQSTGLFEKDLLEKLRK